MNKLEKGLKEFKSLVNEAKSAMDSIESTLEKTRATISPKELETCYVVVSGSKKGITLGTEKPKIERINSSDYNLRIKGRKDENKMHILLHDPTTYQAPVQKEVDESKSSEQNEDLLKQIEQMKAEKAKAEADARKSKAEAVKAKKELKDTTEAANAKIKELTEAKKP